MEEQLEVDLGAFAAAFEGGATVLDVRNPDEYQAGHVPGAVLIPLTELAARQAEIPEGDPLYVICAVGGRSLTATKALVEAGYRAVSVAGGTNGWIERGGAVAQGDQPGGGPAAGAATPPRRTARPGSRRARLAVRPGPRADR